MNRKYIKLGIAAAVVLVIGVIVAYQFTGGQEFSTDMAELRAKFNADKGKVRLLVLLAPT